MSLSGDGHTAIVGGPNDNRDATTTGTPVGAAWVWTYRACPSSTFPTWCQQGLKLVAADAVGKANQGFSVSLSGDGNTAIVGEPNDNRDAATRTSVGAAWVWTRSGVGGWTQQAKLFDPTAGKASQGWSVSLSGDGNTAIVGGPNDNISAAGAIGIGAAWVYTRSGGGWTQQAKLVSTDAAGAAGQGQSVSLSGDGSTAIVGGPNDNNSAGGGVEQFRLLEPLERRPDRVVRPYPRGAVGDVTGGAGQGWSVSLSGDGNTAIVGGPDDSNDDSHFAGAAWVYTRTETPTGLGWSQLGSKLVGYDARNPAEQGFSVSLSGAGNAAIVGGWDDNNGAGAAWAPVNSTFCPNGEVSSAGHCCPPLLTWSDDEEQCIHKQ